MPLRIQWARVRARLALQRAQRRLGLALPFDTFADLTLADVRALTRKVFP